MIYTRQDISDDPKTLARMPGWVTGRNAKAVDDVAFLSGAALSHVHTVLGDKNIPHALLRERLALQAAEGCVTHSGRMERARELRDALAFLQTGDHPGPAGEMYQCWRHAVERPVSVKGLHRALPETEPEQIAEWLDVEQTGPIPRAAYVLQALLQERPRAQTTALVLADAVLAQALGWVHLTPLLALGLKRADLRKTGDELRLVCHNAVISASVEVTRAAADLTRRAARLKAVAPKLRARGADEAVTLFLSKDAVAPTALTSLRSNRAARRFCDRLVELGAVRELTGRDTFRLYGM